MENMQENPSVSTSNVSKTEMKTPSPITGQTVPLKDPIQEHSSTQMEPSNSEQNSTFIHPLLLKTNSSESQESLIISNNELIISTNREIFKSKADLMKRIQGQKSISLHDLWYQYMVYIENYLISNVNDDLKPEFHTFLNTSFDNVLPKKKIHVEINSIYNFTVNHMMNYLNLVPDEKFQVLNKMFFMRCSVILSFLQRLLIDEFKLSIIEYKGFLAATEKNMDTNENIKGIIEGLYDFAHMRLTKSNAESEILNNLMKEITDIQTWFFTLFSA